MKQPYMKPMIAVEELTLDRPIAQNCTADRDDMNSLMDMGYFNDKYTCDIKTIDSQGSIVDSPGLDTVCYHSNVQTAFFS